MGALARQHRHRTVSLGTATATDTTSPTAIASTDVSSPALASLFATGVVGLGALLVSARTRR